MGNPLPENTKIPHLHFMFFDRYETHIQAFVDFINGKLIIFSPHLHKTYFQNMYSHFHDKNERIKTTSKTYGT